jgi:hypothetical protein
MSSTCQVVSPCSFIVVIYLLLSRSHQDEAAAVSPILHDFFEIVYTVIHWSFQKVKRVGQMNDLPYQRS